MSMKEPLLYHAEHTDVTRDCPLSYLSSSVDCHVVFFCLSDLLLTRTGCLGMPSGEGKQLLGE